MDLTVQLSITGVKNYIEKKSKAHEWNSPKNTRVHMKQNWIFSRSIIALQSINGKKTLSLQLWIQWSNQHFYFTFFHVFSPKCIDQLDWLIYAYVNAFGIVRGLKNFFSTSIMGLWMHKEICQGFTKSYSYNKILRCFYFS